MPAISWVSYFDIVYWFREDFEAYGVHVAEEDGVRAPIVRFQDGKSSSKIVSILKTDKKNKSVRFPMSFSSSMC